MKWCEHIVKDGDSWWLKRPTCQVRVDEHNYCCECGAERPDETVCKCKRLKPGEAIMAHMTNPPTCVLCGDELTGPEEPKKLWQHLTTVKDFEECNWTITEKTHTKALAKVAIDRVIEVVESMKDEAWCSQSIEDLKKKLKELL